MQKKTLRVWGTEGLEYNYSGVSGKLRPKTRKTKTWKTKTRKSKTRKTKTLFFFPGEIIKFQLSLPLNGKMNEMNALTPTNNNLVVFFKRNYFRLPQGGVFTVH